MYFIEQSDHRARFLIKLGYLFLDFLQHSSTSEIKQESIYMNHLSEFDVTIKKKIDVF
jgi:hypothetical protein